MKGSSLLETVVVTAIIAILSLTSINSINNFRLNASLDNVSEELVSAIRLARNKSMNGELLPGEDESDFNPTGLPEYGMTFDTNGYQMVRNCLKSDGSNCATDPAIEIVNFNSEYNLSPAGNIYFQRITGVSPNIQITIMEKSGKYGRLINASDEFTISVSRISL